MLLKKCRKCQKEHPYTEFRVEHGYLRNQCRLCKNKQTKLSRERKEFYHKFPKLVRKRRMMTTYKISSEHYNKLNNIQQCESCGRYKKDFKKGLVIDHCHKSGKVRGILCSNCNTTLGLLNDNVVFLKNLINYLELK